MKNIRMKQIKKILLTLLCLPFFSNAMKCETCKQGVAEEAFKVQEKNHSAYFNDIYVYHGKERVGQAEYKYDIKSPNATVEIGYFCLRLSGGENKNWEEHGKLMLALVMHASYTNVQQQIRKSADKKGENERVDFVVQNIREHFQEYYWEKRKVLNALGFKQLCDAQGIEIHFASYTPEQFKTVLNLKEQLTKKLLNHRPNSGL